MDFFSAVQSRRSYYGIEKKSSVPDTRIVELVQFAVKHAPSAFNSQSGRAAVLLGAQHDALWGIVTEALRAIVPADRFAETEKKIQSFSVGYGTVLFFEDQSVVEGLQAQYKLYKDNFPLWSLQSSGMLQYIVWTALEAEGLGVSLQHYNPLIDEAVRQRWGFPQSWCLISQMPFGAPTAKPGEKEFLPIEDRVKVFR